MVEFCEYMGPFGGVCMRRQSPQTLDDELLRYCETHLMIVRRERERVRQQRTQIDAEHKMMEHPSSRQRHAQRSRSEPYLTRSSSRGIHQRVTILEGLDTSDNEDTDISPHRLGDHSTGQWTRSVSSPPRLVGVSRSASPNASDHSRTNTHSHVAATSENQPPSGLRKRVRVKKIVIPPRFEVLDGEDPPSPPKVWYVRLADRVPGDPGDPDDDEYIEINVPEVGHGEIPTTDS